MAQLGSSAEEFESTVLDVELAMERILPDWQRLHRNMGLSQYVNQAQEILDHYRVANAVSTPRAWNEVPTAFCAPDRDSVIPSLSGDLLVKCAPLPWSYSSPSRELLLSTHSPNERSDLSRKTTPPKEVIELGNILGLFARSPDVLRQQYGNDLKKSLLALENVSNQPKLQEMPSGECIEVARQTLNSEFERLQNTFSAEDDRFQWLQLGSL